jgi:hypothetical protein
MQVRPRVPLPVLAGAGVGAGEFVVCVHVYASLPGSLRV